MRFEKGDAEAQFADDKMRRGFKPRRQAGAGDEDIFAFSRSVAGKIYVVEHR